ncbi:MAG: hypothetical protein ACTS22_06385 [Phycisphaerales bacterium]
MTGFEPGGEGFYVGYRPVPARHRRAARFSLAAALVIAVVLGFVLAKTMNDPGDGTWQADSVTTLEGVAFADPSAFLQTPEGPVLLVEAGKHGAGPRLRAVAGRSVEVTGSLIERGSWRMLELVPGDDGLKPSGSEGRFAGSREVGPTVAAVGELLDAKCFLGAMKPGRGRSHKSCAVLCIRGGIPALFVGVTDSGERIAAVVDPSGRLDRTGWLELVGEPVEVRGTLSAVGSLTVLDLESAEMMR